MHQRDSKAFAPDRGTGACVERAQLDDQTDYGRAERAQDGLFATLGVHVEKRRGRSGTVHERATARHAADGHLRVGQATEDGQRRVCGRLQQLHRRRHEHVQRDHDGV